MSVQIGDSGYVRREWVVDLKAPIPVWVFKKWHMLFPSDDFIVHSDGRVAREGDKLIQEKGQVWIEPKKEVA